MLAPRPDHLVAARALEFDRGVFRRRHDGLWNPNLGLTLRAALFVTGLGGRRLHRRLAARANKLDRGAGSRHDGLPVFL
jgi:hypothetical protein